VAQRDRAPTKNEGPNHRGTETQRENGDLCFLCVLLTSDFFAPRKIYWFDNSCSKRACVDRTFCKHSHLGSLLSLCLCVSVVSVFDLIVALLRLPLWLNFSGPSQE
jgi:hypothetical protein